MGMSNIFFLGIRASEKKIGDKGDVTYKDTDSSDTDESTFSAIPASTKKDMRKGWTHETACHAPHQRTLYGKKSHHGKKT